MGRHSIDTIAEVLIDKLDTMEEVAARIEKVAKKPLKVDLEAQEKLLEQFATFINEQNRVEKRVLSQLEDLEAKKKGRIPNWVLGLLFVFFISSIGTIYFAISSIQKVELLEQENQYYKTEYLKAKKGGK